MRETRWTTSTFFAHKIRQEMQHLRVSEILEVCTLRLGVIDAFADVLLALRGIKFNQCV